MPSCKLLPTTNYAKIICCLVLVAAVITIYCCVLIVKVHHDFQWASSDDDDDVKDDCLAETYMKDYALHVKEGCTEEGGNMWLNTFALFFTLVLLYWLIQYAKLDWASTIFQTTTSNNSDFFYTKLGIIVKYVLYSGFLLFSVFYLYNKNNSLGFSAIILIIIIFYNLKDYNRYHRGYHSQGIQKLLRRLPKEKVIKSKPQRMRALAKEYYNEIQTNVQSNINKETLSKDFMYRILGIIVLFVVLYFVHKIKTFIAQAILMIVVLIVFFVSYSTKKFWPVPVVYKAQNVTTPEINNKLKQYTSSSEEIAHIGGAWYNGACLNLCRIVLVSALFHLVSLKITKELKFNPFTDCSQSSTRKTPVPNVNDDCAKYVAIERFDLVASMIMTLLIFVILLSGGTKSQFCRDVIAAEHSSAGVGMTPKQIFCSKDTWKSLGLYVGVFALIGHAVPVAIVTQTGVWNKVRDWSSYISYGMNPTFVAAHKKGFESGQTTIDTATDNKLEGAKSIVTYAMINDLTSNAVTMILLLFVVPEFQKKIWKPLAN